MKKNFSKIICFTLLAALLIGLFTPGIEAMAASTKLSGKKKTAFLNEAQSFLIDALTPIAFYASDDGAKAFAAGTEKPTLNFKKKADRKKFLQYRGIDGGAMTCNEWSQAFFNKTSANYKSVISGDWGDSWPEFKNIKVYKTGEKTYKLSADIYFELDDMTLCRVTMYLKKNADSIEGFNLTKAVFNYSVD